ncbi:ketosynthase chain-length factor [Nocardia sp. CDC159]|uniref:Ketosynthase chain-length factor n=1 Tax=Nocardia pulmonis TaxID=2951408 RepID=A0A9X2E0Z4_9NOCA|nr:MULTISPECIES: ketosynthase chain-length factor [Nocardia]MCM6771859.1 ketosynthase chain-length factor [Nocardia pulmonis]MCM6785483.1 ketosynthase chain-length factor [Nocardia sp. CDC159]
MRTVITGMGVIAPTGLSAAEHWANTLAGQRKIGRITAFDPSGYSATLAGEVPGFTAADHLPGRLLPQTDRVTQLSLVAADHALADAAVAGAELTGFDVGVVTASSAGGFEFGHRELDKLWRKGPQHVSAYQSFAWFYAVNTGQISIRHGMRGPSGVVVTDHAGGLDALALARRRVRTGQPAMVCGAVDGSPCPWGWVAQLTSGRVSTSDDPARAYLPFDAAARGHVPGDGGALFVMESADGARRRGVRSWYGEVAGYAATFDPPPGSGRPSTLRRAIEGALTDAGLEPADVDVVFADAAGTPELDRLEADALRAVFGPHGVPVTAPKTMTGRLHSGGAALDVATALLAMRHGRIPPTTGVTDPVPGYELDLVTETRSQPLSVALVVARGLGGFNAAMVLTEPEHSAVRQITEEEAA